MNFSLSFLHGYGVSSTCTIGFTSSQGDVAITGKPSKENWPAYAARVTQQKKQGNITRSQKKIILLSYNLRQPASYHHTIIIEHSVVIWLYAGY